MQNKFDMVGIIPARYKSSRFPGKPLVDILGTPLIIRVCEKAVEALGKEKTFVATDDKRIADLVVKHGYNCIMTGNNHLTGTDRLAEVASKIDADVYINIQGDEPLLNPNDIINIANTKKKYPDFIINGYIEIDPRHEDPHSINIPKLVINQKSELMYMSRLAIPGIKGSNGTPTYLKQVCIYAFSKEDLELYGTHKTKSYCESYEDIEILRFLEQGKKIKMVRTTGSTLAVDIESDIEKIVEYLKKEND